MRQTIYVALTTATLLTAVGDAACAQSGAREDDSEKMMTISLKCPATNGEVLEYITQNSAGKKFRLQAKYENGRMRRVAIVLEDVGKPALTLFDKDLEVDKDEETQRAGLAWREAADDLKAKICEGTREDREKFNERVRSNARDVGATPEGFTGDPQPKQ